MAWQDWRIHFHLRKKKRKKKYCLWYLCIEEVFTLDSSWSAFEVDKIQQDPIRTYFFFLFFLFWAFLCFVSDLEEVIYCQVPLFVLLFLPLGGMCIHKWDIVICRDVTVPVNAHNNNTGWNPDASWGEHRDHSSPVSKHVHWVRDKGSHILKQYKDYMCDCWHIKLTVLYGKVKHLSCSKSSFFITHADCRALNKNLFWKVFPKITFFSVLHVKKSVSCVFWEERSVELGRALLL